MRLSLVGAIGVRWLGGLELGVVEQKGLDEFNRLSL
jgi:hypothetical protein